MDLQVWLNDGWVRGMARKLINNRMRYYEIIRETPQQFSDWFHGSKVVSQTGKPLKVYRGVVGNHDPIGGKLTWFTDDPEVASEFAGVYPQSSPDKQPEDLWHGGRVYPAYLKILNPFVDENGDWEAVERRIDEIKSKGHDGIMTSEGGADTWIFASNQVWPAYQSISRPGSI